MTTITVGVLALQGAFVEHVQLLKQAAVGLASTSQWEFIEVRTPQELERCAALILPGGESTTMSLVAARSNLLGPLRDFIKYGGASPQCMLKGLATDSIVLGSNASQPGVPAQA